MVVGRVAKPHGVHGDVLVEILTDFPDRLDDGSEFALGDETGPHEFREVHRVRYHKRRWLLSVVGVRDRNLVETWRGRFLYLPEMAEEERPEGYFYEHELVGTECRTREGESLGEVVGIDPGVGQSRLLVRRGRRSYLVPFVPEIVLEVDLESGVVVLAPPPGLLDDDAVTA